VKRVVSRYGHPSERLLRPAIANGYLRIKPQHAKPSLYVHRLVAAAFLGECPRGLEVNHIDGNRINARAENLEYVTRSANNINAVQRRGRGWSPRSKLTSAQVAEIRASSASNPEIAAQYGVSRGVVWRIRTGKSWRL
jgi:hypothetical protein